MTHHQSQAKAKTAPPLKLFLPAHKNTPLPISMQRGTVIYSKSLAEFATSVANKVKSFSAGAHPRVVTLVPSGQFTFCTWQKILLRPLV